jgi:replicative DNA helicase
MLEGMTSPPFLRSTSIAPSSEPPTAAPLGVLPAQAPPPEISEPSEAPRLYALASILGKVEADARAAHEARVSGTARGSITGLSKVDLELNGAFPEGVTVLLGNTGAGKTAFALQAAASNPYPALFVSCEMAPEELLRRHAARVCRQYLNRFKSGEMAPESVLAHMRQAIEAAPLLSIVDATRAFASPRFLRDAAEIARGDARHLLIVIDSLHSWARGLAEGSEYDVLGEALTELRILSRTTQSAVLIVSEQNRASAGKGGVNSGAGHRQIEYGAEVVIDLQRAENAQADGAGEVDVSLKLAKNRHGAAGKSIALKFNGALQSFREA